MSWFRFASGSPKREYGNGFLAGIFSAWRKGQRRSDSRSRKRLGLRSLRIDPLEERCLLSVTPVNLTAILVNQIYGASQTTTTAQSIASDDAGDFVVAWTRASDVVDTAGNPIINPATDSAYQVDNIYARYFTNTVERISLPGPGTSNNNGQYLPNGIATNFDDDSSTVGHFSLTYNDHTIQQISITAGTDPVGDPNALTVNPNIQGQFTLFFNSTGQDIPGELVPTVGGGAQSNLLNVIYDESIPTVAAAQIQNWLQNFAPVANTADVFRQRRPARDRQRHRSAHFRDRLRRGHERPGSIRTADLSQPAK